MICGLEPYAISQQVTGWLVVLPSHQHPLPKHFCCSFSQVGYAVILMTCYKCSSRKMATSHPLHPLCPRKDHETADRDEEKVKRCNKGVIFMINLLNIQVTVVVKSWASHYLSFVPSFLPSFLSTSPHLFNKYIRLSSMCQVLV